MRKMVPTRRINKNHMHVLVHHVKLPMVSPVWFAPAGLRRGVINTAVTGGILREGLDADECQRRIERAIQWCKDEFGPPAYQMEESHDRGRRRLAFPRNPLWTNEEGSSCMVFCFRNQVDAAAFKIVFC